MNLNPPLNARTDVFHLSQNTAARMGYNMQIEWAAWAAPPRLERGPPERSGRQSISGRRAGGVVSRYAAKARQQDLV